jgi:hypothetical protein
VCPRAVGFSARRLPTRRTLARGAGCVHIPIPRGRGPPGRRPATSVRLGDDRFTYQPRTYDGRLPRSRARSTVRCGTLVLGRLYDPGTEAGTEPGAEAGTDPGQKQVQRRVSTPVDGADRGNQPIHRRVDTISKQYQVSSRTRDASHDGGGAPWES